MKYLKEAFIFFCIGYTVTNIAINILNFESVYIYFILGAFFNSWLISKFL